MNAIAIIIFSFTGYYAVHYAGTHQDSLLSLLAYGWGFLLFGIFTVPMIFKPLKRTGGLACFLMGIGAYFLADTLNTAHSSRESDLLGYVLVYMALISVVTIAKGLFRFIWPYPDPKCPKCEKENDKSKKKNKIIHSFSKDVPIRTREHLVCTKCDTEWDAEGIKCSECGDDWYTKLVDQKNFPRNLNTKRRVESLINVIRKIQLLKSGNITMNA
jgi:hypothetical protein